jgi:hypothetical protein
MLDKENGRIIYFEGTYTTTFSGNPNPTPRYDYNQVMYRLDLSDRRLALPVAIYETPGERGTIRLVARQGLSPTDRSRVAFFAPDRPGVGTMPVHEHVDATGRRTLRVGNGDRPTDGTAPEPIFFILPDDHSGQGGATVRLFEHPYEVGGPTYTLQGPGAAVGASSVARVIGRVWRNPVRSFRR